MYNMNGTIVKKFAVYLQNIWNITDKWNLTLGGRYDDSNLFDSKATGNAKLGYKFNEKSNIYVSYGNFFNSPDIYSLYSGEHGNSSLKPEQGYNEEIGINHKIGKSFTLSAHAFRRKTTDKISYNYATERYENLSGDEKARGYDIQMQKVFSKLWTGKLGYSYVKTDAGDGNINNHGYIPKHSVNLGVDYDIKKFNANLTVRGVIDRPGYESGTIGKFFPSTTYWLTDIGFNYTADKHHKVWLKVNNLFDKFYAEQSNAMTLWGGAAEQWWPMPGRSFLVGFEYTF